MEKKKEERETKKSKKDQTEKETELSRGRERDIHGQAQRARCVKTTEWRTRGYSGGLISYRIKEPGEARQRAGRVATATATATARAAATEPTRLGQRKRGGGRGEGGRENELTSCRAGGVGFHAVGSGDAMVVVVCSLMQVG